MALPESAALNQADGLHPTAAGVDVIVKGMLPKAEELVIAREARELRDDRHITVLIGLAKSRHDSAHLIRGAAGPRVECKMPRLFTGLEIPEEVAQSLSLLRGGLPGARWIDPENYHITLRFIGDIDDRAGARDRVAARRRAAAQLRGALRRI